jgi:hypothetical protein
MCGDSAVTFDYWVSTLFDLLKPARVGDIGPGKVKYGRMARDKAKALEYHCRTTAVEIDESYVEQFGLRQLYDEVVVADAVTLIDDSKLRYDLVILGDSIEHMRKSAGVDLLNFLVYRSGYILVITPSGYLQDAEDGHAAEAHISTWSIADFPGWDVLTKTQTVGSWTLNLFLIKGYLPTRLRITG